VNSKLKTMNLRNMRAWGGLCIRPMSKRRLRFRMTRQTCESQERYIEGIITFRNVRPR
jgi:hypothetical protein